MKAKLIYYSPRHTDPEDREPDVLIEMTDPESIGMSIPQDGAELNYFSPAEALMIATALMEMARDG